MTGNKVITCYKLYTTNVSNCVGIFRRLFVQIMIEIMHPVSSLRFRPRVCFLLAKECGDAQYGICYSSYQLIRIIEEEKNLCILSFVMNCTVFTLANMLYSVLRHAT